MKIGPGSSVDLVLNLDLLQETTEVRRAVIYDTEDNTYILSQTNPPVRRSSIGMTYHITHLTRQGDQYVRYGFEGKLIDIIRDYQLNSSQSVQASIFRRQSGLDMYDLRMHYRVRPGMDWSYTFSLESRPVNLINISLGGALFSHSGKNKIEVGQTVQVTGQGTDGEQLPGILAKVKRVWAPLESRQTGLEFVAVQFSTRDAGLVRELGREILQTQRGAVYRA
jgi:hypothetical protein